MVETWKITHFFGTQKEILILRLMKGGSAPAEKEGANHGERDGVGTQLRVCMDVDRQIDD